jgi:hypothetical protein
MNAPGGPDYEPGVRANPEMVPVAVEVDDDGVYKIDYIAGLRESSISVRLIRRRGSDEVDYVMLNGDDDVIDFVPPESDLHNWISLALIACLGQPLGGDASDWTALS